MKKIVSFFIITFIILSFTFSLDRNSENALTSHRGSCSIITCKVDDTILYGYNHDGHEYLEPFILFGDHITFQDGETVYFGKPICNTGRMTLDGPRDDYANLTTDGLCFAYNSLASIPMYIDPLKENYSDSVGGFGPVSECSTVEEVISFYKQYNYFRPNPNPQWDLQYHWADAEGKAIVVGLNETGNVTITEMNESQYLISTNLNLAYPECCDGPCSDSNWRINKANEMLQTIVTEESLTVETMREVLEAISVESTVHGLVFNPKTLDIYAYYRHDFSQVFKFNIEEELSTLATDEVRLYDLKEMYDNSDTQTSNISVIISVFSLVLLIIKAKKR
ncbi:MAG: hypothetical protein ACW981_17225 [Candidatus Hodarchaeales archaeon]|jgi:hypothetical protein